MRFMKLGLTIISASKQRVFYIYNIFLKIDDAVFNGQSKLRHWDLIDNQLNVVRAQWCEILEYIINTRDNLISAFEPSDFKWPTSALKIFLIMLKRN